MIYLIAAVALTGTLAVLNLIFTLGVVRRLREHTERLAKMSSGDQTGVAFMKDVGEQVAEFAAVTIDGMAVSRASLGGTTMVGFFTAHCPPCRDSAPVFAAVVRGMPDRNRGLAVVVGDEQDTATFAATYLADAVPVVLERDAPDFGPIVAAFGVNAFPIFCLVDDEGVIAAIASSPEDLPVHALV